MESKAALVWTQGRVELDTISAVELELSLIVFPDHTELDDSLGDGDNLESSLVLRILLEESAVLQGRSQL